MAGNKKRPLDDAMKKAKEVEVADHQHEWEAGVLATLAASINDDQGFEPDKIERLDAFKYRILADIDEDILQRSDHRAIFRAMKALDDQGEGVDASLVADWLKKNGADDFDQNVIDDIFKADPLADAGILRTYINRLTARARSRHFRDYTAALHLKAKEIDAMTDPVAIDQAIGDIQSFTFDLARKRKLITDARSESALLDDFADDLSRRRSDKGFVGLDTGFNHLNQVFNGLNQGLYIFAGAPSCGKTTFIKQMADQVAEKNGVPVVFFSFEQSAEELRVKTLARLSGVNSRDIVKGRTDRQIEAFSGAPKETLWSKVEAAFDKYKAFGQSVFIVEAGWDHTIEKIRVLAQTIRQQSQAGRVLIVADYLQIMPTDPSLRFATTKDKVDYLCSELRRLARDLDSPVIAISSENREAYKNNKSPTMAAFKESGGIEYSADVAGAFWTEKRTDANNRFVSLKIMKNRNGELAKVGYTFMPDQAKFVEGDKEELFYIDSLMVEVDD